MSRFRMHLYQGPTSDTVTESLDVEFDEDALDLAQVVLLSTSHYTRAEVYRGEALVGALVRDSYANRNEAH